MLREGRVTNYELTAKSKDGRATVVSYNASTFRDASGKLQGVFAAARDITEQKKLEQQLRESESYNRGLIEASVDGLITVDPSGIISDVNEQMCRMSGYPREELIGTPFADYFADPERATAGVNETFEKGVVTDYVLTLTRRSGAAMRVSFNASVFRDASGQCAGHLRLGPRHHRAGAAAGAARGRARLQPRPDRSFARRPDHGGPDAEHHRRQRDDVPDVRLHPNGADRHAVPAILHRSEARRRRRAPDARQGRGHQLRADAAHAKTARSAWSRSTPRSSRTPSGKVRGIFASARDITEQARLQGQLAEERAYNRGLIEASVDGLVTVDEEMTITDVNETMCRMVGRPRTQLIGSSFPAYFAERDRAAEGVQPDLQGRRRHQLRADPAGGGRQAGSGIVQRRGVSGSRRARSAAFSPPPATSPPRSGWKSSCRHRRSTPAR